MKIGVIDWIALVLVIVGALNWGLVLFDFNLVTWISFGVAVVESTVYALVGLAGLWMIYVASRLAK